MSVFLSFVEEHLLCPLDDLQIAVQRLLSEKSTKPQKSLYRNLKIAERTQQVLFDKTQKHGYHLRSLSPSEAKLEGLYERRRKLNVREAIIAIREVKETTRSKRISLSFETGKSKSSMYRILKMVERTQQTLFDKLRNTDIIYARLALAKQSSRDSTSEDGN